MSNSKMKVCVQFLEVKKNLDKAEFKLLNRIVNKHAQTAGSLLGVSSVNITVYPNAGFTIPETGEGGYTVSGDWFHIYIDPTKKKSEIRNTIEKIIPETIYHEMSHVARWNTTGYGLSLLDAIITEGLATVFADEQWSDYEAPWAHSSKKEIISLLNIFKQRDKKKDDFYNHEEWFYGTDNLPRWIGYKIGFHVIKSFRKNNRDISWSKIMEMTSDRIVKMSKVHVK